MPTVTGRAISIPEIRKPPSGKCRYDPNIDMRAKSDAYQGIIYGINKNIVIQNLQIKCTRLNQLYLRIVTFAI